MIKEHRFSIFLVSFLCLTISTHNSAAVSNNDIYQILRQHNIPFDGSRIEKAVINAMLKSADPFARILSEDEIKTFNERKTLNTAETWAEGICYIKLNGMFNDGATELLGALQTLREEKKLGGLIMDLRNACGSDIDTINKIADEFSEKDSWEYWLTDMNNKILNKQSASSEKKNPDKIVPLILLINENTCAGSEVLASILQSLKGITVLGQPSRGDSRLRETLSLPDNKMLLISTRKVSLSNKPDDLSLQVIPDIKVSNKTASDKRIKALDKKPGSKKPLSEKSIDDRELMSRVAKDVALSRAVDILLGLKALGIYDTNETTDNTSSATEE